MSGSRMRPTWGIAFCGVMLAPLAHAQTVDEIIAKNLQARGGLAKIKAVQSMKSSGTLTQGSFRARFIQENLRPNHVREELVIQGMSRIEAFDGKTGWRVSPFEGRKDPDLLSADDMKGLITDADIDGQLVDYRNKDHRAQLEGHDTVEGTDCYKIKLTLSNGDVRYFFIDTDSYLELKVETQRNIRGTVEYSETYYGDYEEVNGIYFPFDIETGEKGSTDRVKLTVDKVELNVPVAGSVFTIPTVGAK
jgi:hypothetical protein